MPLHLLDSNVLLRAANSQDPQHGMIRAYLIAGRNAGDTYTAASQNFIESWNVLTRPTTARGGYGFTPADVAQSLSAIASIVPRLPDPDGDVLYPEWLRLVTTYQVSGVQVHDARLVAMMLVSGISSIVTLNDKDFLRFAAEGIVATNPTTPPPPASTPP